MAPKRAQTQKQKENEKPKTFYEALFPNGLEEEEEKEGKELFVDYIYKEKDGKVEEEIEFWFPGEGRFYWIIDYSDFEPGWIKVMEKENIGDIVGSYYSDYSELKVKNMRELFERFKKEPEKVVEEITGRIVKISKVIDNEWIEKENKNEIDDDYPDYPDCDEEEDEY
jgi:hypothetical protein